MGVLMWAKLTGMWIIFVLACHYSMGCSIVIFNFSEHVKKRASYQIAFSDHSWNRATCLISLPNGFLPVIVTDGLILMCI